jgi:hypothetical protein
MEASVWAAIIAVAGAALSFYLTKHYERKMEWQREKINHYKIFLDALSDLANNKGDKKVLEKMANAGNALAIIAPQRVISIWMKLLEVLSAPNFSVDRQDELIRELVLAIRQDINLPNKDDPNTFSYTLITGGKSNK